MYIKKIITINEIQLKNFRFFIDEHENNTFNPNKNGLLVYGENGSGKSSLFKAFDFLTKPSISEVEFNDNINIFKNDDTSLNFEFSNKETLNINIDNLSLENNYPFIEKISIPKLIIDYKLLLNVSYTNETTKNKNLYDFFVKILENYPIKINNQYISLKDIDDPEDYFEEYKKIIQNDLLENINVFLKQFDQNFIITNIKLSGIGKTAFLEIDYFNEEIKTYQNFLNEARLSALAISVYFSIIKKQFSFLGEDSLKILVLDDLLVRFDMNNRLRLINILKKEFSEFQIFFFTHEKALFNLVKEKMKLEPYEIFVRKKDDYVAPFIKNSNTLLEQAIHQKNTYNYGCSANLLRQDTERLLCKYLEPELQIGKGCKLLNLETLLTRAVTFEKNKKKTIKATNY